MEKPYLILKINNLMSLIQQASKTKLRVVNMEKLSSYNGHESVTWNFIVLIEVNNIKKEVLQNVFIQGNNVF